MFLSRRCERHPSPRPSPRSGEREQSAAHFSPKRGERAIRAGAYAAVANRLPDSQARAKGRKSLGALGAKMAQSRRKKIGLVELPVEAVMTRKNPRTPTLPGAPGNLTPGAPGRLAASATRRCRLKAEL